MYYLNPAPETCISTTSMAISAASWDLPVNPSMSCDLLNSLINDVTPHLQASPKKFHLNPHPNHLQPCPDTWVSHPSTSLDLHVFPNFTQITSHLHLGSLGPAICISTPSRFRLISIQVPVFASHLHQVPVLASQHHIGHIPPQSRPRDLHLNPI